MRDAGVVLALEVIERRDVEVHCNVREVRERGKVNSLRVPALRALYYPMACYIGYPQNLPFVEKYWK